MSNFRTIVDHSQVEFTVGSHVVVSPVLSPDPPHLHPPAEACGPGQPTTKEMNADSGAGVGVDDE